MPSHYDTMTPAEKAAFSIKYTSRAERIEITDRSKNTPGTRAAEARADRIGTRKVIRATLAAPAIAAKAGIFSRAKRNAAEKRKKDKK